MMNLLPPINLKDLGHPDWERPASETTVVVGMSGGVDSSLCAVWLKLSGFRVIGLFMKNWEEEDEFGVCQASKEFLDVEKVCEKYQIPSYTIDFVKEYRENVFQSFLDEYRLGYTPNPDILCNREIKFKVFYEKAKQFGADFLATGHYCQIEFKNSVHKLIKGVDSNKDQTYFLYTIQEEVLRNVIFPIGHLYKDQVREFAQKLELNVFNKKDSTGICFIGERNFRNFLSQYIDSSKGEFVTLDGQKVGTHQGSVFYTPGQRKGLGLGGPGEPWYVLDKDVEKNIVYVGRGHDHPALFSDHLFCDEVSWVNSPPSLPLKCKAKIRYRQSDQNCEVHFWKSGELKVVFEEPQRAAAIRQSIVFYLDEVCLGGGMISQIGQSDPPKN